MSDYEVGYGWHGKEPKEPKTQLGYYRNRVKVLERAIMIASTSVCSGTGKELYDFAICLAEQEIGNE